MKKLLISRCLIGDKCRYDGLNKPLPASTLEALKKKYELIPICPEAMGGLTTPRIANERRENRVIRKDGVDVSKDIRTEQISIFSTKWATIAEIKNIVRTIQKEFIKKYDTVMEGRDIGTLIAPNADYKFYLYSDFETRVNRLWNEDKTKDISTIRKELTIRDNLDINGGNFIKPENSIEIDTTNYSIEEVYNIMISKIIIN